MFYWGRCGLFHFAAFKRQGCGIDVEQRPQLVHIGVAVARQGDERGDVQRCVGTFRSKGARGGAEIVVTIDQDARVFCGDHLRQGFGGEVGERKANGTANVAQGVFVGAAGIEHEGAFFRGHGGKLFFGDAALFADCLGFSRDFHVAGIVDLRVSSLIRGDESGGSEHERDEGGFHEGSLPRL